nr:ABC transporter permease [Microvirga terrestris]
MLDRKVLRDLWGMRGHVFTIILLVATGVTVLVGSVSTYVSLLSTQETYYRDSRFAELWADVKRAPRYLLQGLSEIPGAALVEARVIKDVRVAWPQSDLSVAGRIISIPADEQPQLNRLHLIKGHWIDSLRRNDVLVNVGFAETWDVAPGNFIDIIMNGRMQTFRVAGIAHSPEFVYASRPGNPLPDDRTFVVLWAGEGAIAAAFDMEGAFNNVAVSLAPGASAESVMSVLDE